MRPSVDKSSRSGLVPVHPAGDEMLTARRDPRASEAVAPGSLPYSKPGAAQLEVRGRAANFNDLKGRTFGQWTALYYVGTQNQRPRWHCRCSCGTERSVLAMQLMSGATRSCGCQQATYNRATRDAQVARIDAFLELAKAAEEYVRKCVPCRGTGSLTEQFECFPMIRGERIQRVPAASATKRAPCPECGELRRAIQRTQEIPA